MPGQGRVSEKVPEKVWEVQGRSRPTGFQRKVLEKAWEALAQSHVNRVPESEKKFQGDFMQTELRHVQHFQEKVLENVWETLVQDGAGPIRARSGSAGFQVRFLSRLLCRAKSDSTAGMKVRLGGVGEEPG